MARSVFASDNDAGLIGTFVRADGRIDRHHDAL
jgi:hypothetical protein